MPRTDTPSDQPDHAEKRRARKRELSQATREFRRRLDVPVPDEDLPVQAIFHWGLDDQEQALLAAREAEPKPGFMMRLLALCTLPRTNPGDDQLQYRRVNGPFTLIHDGHRLEAPLRHAAQVAAGVVVQRGGPDPITRDSPRPFPGRLPPEARNRQ